MPWQNARRNCQESAAYAVELPGALRRMPKITLARRRLVPLTRRGYDWQVTQSIVNRNLRPSSRKVPLGRGIRGSGLVPRNPGVPLQPRIDRGYGEGED